MSMWSIRRASKPASAMSGNPRSLHEVFWLVDWHAQSIRNTNDNGFFALLRHHGQLDLARVDIEHRLGYLPLRKQRLSLQELEARFTFVDLGEKQLGVKKRRS